MDSNDNINWKNSKLKKILKRVLISLWIIAWLIWVFFLAAILCAMYPINDRILVAIFITMWLIIILIWMIVLVIKIFIKKDNIIRKKFKRKLLILSIILIISWWWLTYAWLIPNRFNIKFLYRDNDCSNFNCDSLAEVPIFVNGVGCVCARDISSGYYKPIIYLYPEKEETIQVKLWNPQNLSHTYPKYDLNKWWNVIAQPNWDLIDVNTNRELYSLYREWTSNSKTKFNEWFVVAWKDIIPFLEEKLAILGLNEREAEEFIVYWLPEMENNKWNLIRFKTIEEIDKDMPLDITPVPDTVIRIMMDWKAIDEPINISEQTLVTPERIWFTVVEWWGSPKN